MPAGATYDPIATYTLPSAAASYTFTSISQSYTDFVCVIYLQAGATNYDIQVGAANSIDTSANYNSTRVYANGTSVGTDGQNSNTTGVLGNVSNSTSNPQIAILNFNGYTSTNMLKGAMSNFSSSDMYTFYVAGLWRSNSAINCLRLYSTSGQNIPSGTSLTLYGIAGA
jgi:hypothetical protein